jgi:hypothetical protein
MPARRRNGVTTESTENTERERIFTAEHAETAENEGRMIFIVSSPSLSVCSVFSVVNPFLLGDLGDLGG